MKSAYDLAMERLEKQSPSVKLTEEQRSQLAEVDSLYKSRIAEKELLLNDQIRREQAAGKPSEVESLRKQLASEIRRLTEECESKKERMNNGLCSLAPWRSENANGSHLKAGDLNSAAADWSRFPLGTKLNICGNALYLCCGRLRAGTGLDQ